MTELGPTLRAALTRRVDRPEQISLTRARTRWRSGSAGGSSTMSELDPKLREALTRVDRPEQISLTRARTRCGAAAQDGALP